ncbi:tRNA wybutosine-synthesizing protein 2 [Dermatophagoides farinae]|uniref:tRNA(Phe) (4-demethylwyosine(37)-C(7)) aminocarboxypropyltransferase n=1 Tax=Dermatophagoides farinae TaxID=6954 RepID=A0A922L908_DERFA|nr:tRNA wybutosine-synthesizing protein 2 [Dermatophagoides farinae]
MNDIRFVRYGDLILFNEQSFLSEFNLNSRDDELFQTIRKNSNEKFEQLRQRLRFKRAALISKIIDDDFRTPNVHLFYSQDYDSCSDNSIDPWALQIDNGIKYTFDITRTMFCKGNISEKIRLAKFDCHDEIVVDLFAGIGYFALIFAVHCHARHVYCCEWNPAAIEALRRNIQLNHVQDRDNRQVCPRGIAHRIHMGLIPTSLDSLEIGCQALDLNSDKDLIMHVHENLSYYELIKQSIGQNKRAIVDEHRKKWATNICEQISTILTKLSAKNNDFPLYDVSYGQIIRIKRYAPHIDHMVVDVCIRKWKKF